MNLSKVKVEQILKNGNIILDYSEILSKKERINILNTYFKDLNIKDKFIYGNYK
jgi:hypothetical protein